MTIISKTADLTKVINETVKELEVTEASLDTQVTTASNYATTAATYETTAEGYRDEAAVSATAASTHLATVESNVTYSGIPQISESITATAVDVFIYDTSKDSDGGAWRKRTQHTSWYNEELNTVNRGSRREFPAVAVIVATSSGFTIYDGDDSTLPMWKRFIYSSGTFPLFYYAASTSSCTALNGKIVTGGALGTPTNGGGCRIFDFLTDKVTLISGAYGGNRGYITERLSFSSLSAGDFNKVMRTSSIYLVNIVVNDVAMTVLPNAPIDPETGLPVPTIAVATNGGVSIIRDDGTIYSFGGVLLTTALSISSDNSLLTVGRLASGRKMSSFLGKSTLAVESGDGGNSFTAIYKMSSDFGTATQIAYDYAGAINDTPDFIHGGAHRKLSLVDIDSSLFDNSLVSDIRSNYTTGWMPGDIKGAFLADTSDSSLIGTELVPNGDKWIGASNSRLPDGATNVGWYASSNGTYSVNGGVLTVTNGTNGRTGFYFPVSVSIGATYEVQWSGITDQNGQVRITDIINPTDISPFNSLNRGSSGSYRFIADTSTLYVSFTNYSSLSGYSVSIDTLSFRQVERDRSVNDTPLSVSYSEYEPDLDFVFTAEDYTTNNTSTDFDSAIVATRNSNATMVDSDGLLKWAPHNELTYSEEFENPAWPKSTIAVISNQATSPDGTTTADLLYPISTGSLRRTLRPISGLTDGAKYTAVYYIKPTSGFGSKYVQVMCCRATMYVDLSDGSIGEITGSPTNTSVTLVDEGYYKIELSAVATLSAGSQYVQILFADADNSLAITADGTEGFYCWGAHLYRSDLGGMVNNPDRGDSYVPTTTSARYLPRRGHHVYDGSAWVNEGLLVESEERTNLQLYSDNFTASGWNSNNAGTLTQDTVAPDGTLSAWTMVDDNTGGSADVNISRFFSGVIDTTSFTASIFAKADGNSFIALRTLFFNAGQDFSWFDLSAGTVGTVGTNHDSATIEDYGNGWYRCSITFTTGVGEDATGAVYFGTCESNGVWTTPKDGTSSTKFWGVQIEQGSTPSSYIPTSGSTATRAAETLTVPSANLPYNNTAMSIQMEGKMTYADEDTALNEIFYRWYINGGNKIETYISTSSTNVGTVVFDQRELISGVGVVISPELFSPGILVPYNISSRHGSTFINGAVDGTALTANTTPTALPDLSTTDLNLAYDYMGTIKRFRIWDEDVADTGIEKASSNLTLVKTAGTITRSPVAEGAELVAYSGFRSVSGSEKYLYQPYNSDLDFGTGDFSIMFWINDPGGSSTTSILQRKGIGGLDAGFKIWRITSTSSRALVFTVGDSPSAVASSATPINTWTHVTMLRQNEELSIYFNGNLSTGGVANTYNIVSDQPLYFGVNSDIGEANLAIKYALLRISATAPSADQIKKIYEDEKKLFQPGAQCTLYGSSDTVTGLDHDSKTNLLHVGTSAGRSVFDGLVRVDNTTTPVSTAISAVNGMIVED